MVSISIGISLDFMCGNNGYHFSVYSMIMDYPFPVNQFTLVEKNDTSA